jgi:uncharacterized membrane protein
MKLKVLIGILVFLIVLNLATIGTFLYVHFSQQTAEPTGRFGHRADMRAAPGMRPGIGERVRFQHGEREELRAFLHQFREETRELRDRVSDLEREVFELMQTDPVPKQRVDSLLKEISLSQYEISKSAAAKMIEAKKILSPEQQTRFFEAIHRSHTMMRGESRRPGLERGQRHRRRPDPPDSTGR